MGKPTYEGMEELPRFMPDCCFMHKPVVQEERCFTMATQSVHMKKDEEFGFCHDSEEEALDEERLQIEEKEALARGASLAVERADILKAVRVLKRIAKA